LFIYISVILQSTWNVDTKMLLLSIGFVGFWGSAAWLNSENARGQYVEGLQITENIVFRPDVVLPQGVLLVKAIILMGMGYLISVQKVTRLPIWNWNGFLLAFWGIIILIPFRGAFKLFVGRRNRMLGRPFGSSFTYHVLVFLFTVIGLFILMYGFLNAFMGTNPFDSSRLSIKDGKRNTGRLLMIISLITLLFHEAIVKPRKHEAINDRQPRRFQDILLLLGIILFINSFIVSFMGRWMYPQFSSNLKGAIFGISILITGLYLFLWSRPRSNYLDYFSIIEIMTGVIAASSEENRKILMSDRINTLATADNDVRIPEIKAMMKGMNSLQEDLKSNLMMTQMIVLSELDSEKRKIMMQSMDEVNKLLPSK
ncbi:MAG: hypothetical protein ACC656_11175, partial [Candidatus Heimdallarchaeota archaeon]